MSVKSCRPFVCAMTDRMTAGNAGNGAATEPLVAGSPVGSDLGEAANEKQKTKSMQHPIVEEKVAAAADHSLLNSPEPGLGNPPCVEVACTSLECHVTCS